MKKKKKKTNSVWTVLLIILVIGMLNPIIEAFSELVGGPTGRIDMLPILIVLAFAVLIYFVSKGMIEKKQKGLLDEILDELHLEDIEVQLPEYDDRVIVKSRQTLENYTDLKYIKDNGDFESIRLKSEVRKDIENRLSSFIADNDYKKRFQYCYVERQLENYAKLADGYRVLVTYITPAGNPKENRKCHISASRIDEIATHPEYLMTKSDYNKVLKQQTKEELDAKKHALYDRVNIIIYSANEMKDTLVSKSRIKCVDELVQKLFDKTINSIQKVSTIDSDEWDMLEGFITSIENQIREIIQNDRKISKYYASEEFAKIKNTCSLLMQSQKEFNEYINEKAQSITQLFGVRIVRNETQNEDTNNYIRSYKKSITPFTAEVSSTVFGSAENNPIGYIVKYFYPNKSQYPVQIEKLRLLIEELETLKEAKVIIDNYKKEYNQYILDVPDYVLEDDEAGFYSRLGLAIIDESVLNVEYKFTYTSDGGMAQRSFTVPMNEDNITELVHLLESKLTSEALVKEQRALMTTKLRAFIKERDNYTCCQCGNSIQQEPNLLLEIDHIIPVSKGGLTKEDNLQTLCWKCNRNKGAKLFF